MESKRNNNTPTKLNKRRSHKRKPSLDKFINISEARREIVHFLHLHRSPPPPPPPSSTSSIWDPPIISFNRSRNVSEIYYHDHQPLICYPSIESLPVPGPTWSTTAPSVLAPPPPPPPPMETLEFFDCSENQSSSSSYTWWFEFLQTLDCKKKTATDDVSKYPAFGEIYRRNYKRKGLFGQWELNVNDHHDDDDDQINPSPDEWLTFPSSEEDQGEVLL